MNKPATQKATYEDLLAVPEGLVAEILFGELHTHPRPGPRHALASTLLTEPECHRDADVVVPDIAGWWQTIMPELPETAQIAICPDWVCEVLIAIDGSDGQNSQARDLRKPWRTRLLACEE